MLASATVIDELERALHHAGAREIAGLLLEAPDGSQCIRLAPNIASDSGTVEIPGWWICSQLQRIERDGARPIAFFHSHMSTLEPSDTDRVAVRDSPLPWIILLLDNGRLTWAETYPAT